MITIPLFFPLIEAAETKKELSHIITCAERCIDGQRYNGDDGDWKKLSDALKTKMTALDAKAVQP